MQSKIVSTMIGVGMVLFVAACSSSSSGGGGGGNVSATTTLLSSDVSGSEGAGVNAMQVFLPATLNSDCPVAEMLSCITPTMVAGMAYYAGVMVGTGSTGYSVGPILGDVIDPSEATSFSMDELNNFDLADGIATSGSATCCEGSPFPEDAEAYVRSAHVYFGYVDVTFTLDGADGVPVALQDTHTIRAIFADIDDTEYEKGDLLYKADDDTDFSWCTIAAGCTHDTRPADPVQYTEIANFSNSGEGNPVIPDFVADLEEGQTGPQLTETALTTEGIQWAFTVNFDMENGAGFTVDPTTMTTIVELVDAFRLAADPRGGDTGFTATVTVTQS